MRQSEQEKRQSKVNPGVLDHIEEMEERQSKQGELEESQSKQESEERQSEQEEWEEKQSEQEEEEDRVRALPSEDHSPGEIDPSGDDGGKPQRTHGHLIGLRPHNVSTREHLSSLYPSAD